MDTAKASLINFVLEICPPILDCSRQELQAILTSKSDEKISQFLVDQQLQCLVVGKETTRIPVSSSQMIDSGTSGGASSSSVPPEYPYPSSAAGIEKAEGGPLGTTSSTYETHSKLFLDTSLKKRAQNAAECTAVGFIKRLNFNIPLDDDPGEASQTQVSTFTEGASSRLISTQLLVMNMGVPEMSLLELGQAYFQHGFSPLMMLASTLTGPGGGGATVDSIEEEGRETVSLASNSLSRKVDELVMVIKQAQQSVDIPIVSLQIEPVIRRAVERASYEDRKAQITDLDDYMNDRSFQNLLQSTVNRWIQEINKVTKLQRDANATRTLEEVNFWLELEKSLNNIEKQLQTPEVELTLNFLKQSKRVFATMSFDSDIGLKQAMERTSSITAVMKDFPLNDLLSATSVEKINNAIRAIFVHFKKMKNVAHYSAHRCFQLAEAVSRDMSEVLMKVLSAQKLVHMDYESFEFTASGCAQLFLTWQVEFRHFKDMVAKKRVASEPIPIEPAFEHDKIQSRLTEFHDIREQHQKLKSVASKVLHEQRSTDLDAQRFLSQAFKLFTSIDVLDVSRSGAEVWEAATKAYAAKIDRIESQIAAKLRDRLGSAKHSNEMFRIFSKFNALFIRPRIRGAIQEYQTTLIQHLKSDLERLQNKFLQGYSNSDASKVSALRDLSPIAGAMIWANQIEKRILTIYKRCEDVLGNYWEQHAEGHQLKEQIDVFLGRLNHKEFLEKKFEEIKDCKGFDRSSKVFCIQKLGRHGYRLSVNYDPLAIMAFKEVRMLQAMQYRVLYSYKLLSDETKPAYPSVMILQETVRAYFQTTMKLQELKARGPFEEAIAGLVTFYQKELQGMLTNNITILWRSDSLESFTRSFAEKVYSFESKIEDVFAQSQMIRDNVERLRTLSLPSSIEEFKEIMKKTQKSIDHFHTQNFSNVEKFFRQIDALAEEILEKRLGEIVALWTKEFEKWPDAGTSLISKTLRHEFKLHNQALVLCPSIEGARQHWFGELHQNFELITRLPRLRCHSSNEFMDCYSDAGDDQEAESDEELLRTDHSSRKLHTREFFFLRKNDTYRHVVNQLDPKILDDAYDAIEDSVAKLGEYVSSWYYYQSLFDLEVHDIIPRIDDNIETWRKLLNEIKASRTTFDTSSTRHLIGPMVIDYRQVQVKVNKKYEVWHREILSAFGVKVFESVSGFSMKLKGLLEGLSLQNTIKEQHSEKHDMNALKFLSMSDEQVEILLAGTVNVAKGDELLESIVTCLTQFIANIEASFRFEYEGGYNQLEGFKASEKLLQRQRYVFLAEWIWVESLESDWESFMQLLYHQYALLESRIGCVENVISLFRRRVQDKLQDLYNEWREVRPTRFSSSPVDAMSVLDRMSGRIGKAKKNYEMHQQGVAILQEVYKGALRTDDESIKITPDEIEEEINNLRGVWSELKGIYEAFQTASDTQWAMVVPKKIRQDLEKIIDQIKQIPARFRQFEAFEDFRIRIEGYLKMNILINDLKLESLKERHWKLILAKLRLRVPYSDLTIGAIWTSKLLENEQEIKEIISQSQGEMAVEQFLRGVRDFWSDSELELVLYQNKCKLIKGWDDLFSVIGDFLNAFQSMKSSPFFKIFEEEATTWEEKLNKLRTLLESQMEVQRKWIYLEGVFKSSIDINVLLPNEYQRFKAIDSDFISIMKKIVGFPSIADYASIDGLQRQLDRLSEMLSKVQKALGEYLARQRSEFSRFYFVGDEDLLEMIGNAKNISVIQRHLGKMFAGICYLGVSSEDENIIVDVRSREGEILTLLNPIDVRTYASLKDWMAAVEKNVSNTLATSLGQALSELSSFVFPEDSPIRLIDESAPILPPGAVISTPPLPASVSPSSALAASPTAGEETDLLMLWIEKFPLQIILLSLQVAWTAQCEKFLEISAGGDVEGGKASSSGGYVSPAEEGHPSSGSVTHSLREPLARVVNLLNYLSDKVISDISVLLRQKVTQMVTEVIHQRDVLRFLILENVSSNRDFRWMQFMRFYCKYTPEVSLKVSIADALFDYGFEYLGLVEKLVQTPLTDRCFLTLTQALHLRLGGNPFGPAGTGKTESVKALGAQLGKFVLVFNCDESFDFQAMGRIFVGLCQVGAWGCFDEFNRLEERILSAVSEQILSIQTGLRDGRKHIELLNNTINLDFSVGIFVTMNPSYAGRSNLPDNLKQLFRETAMISPDKEMIAQVTLFSQGFRTAERLSSKIVSLFDLCNQQMSRQPHYDFGLRSLKSVLLSAGNLKRTVLKSLKSDADLVEVEQSLLIRSIYDSFVPRLISEDIPLLFNLLQGVFPGVNIAAIEEKLLVEELGFQCVSRHYEMGEKWLNKVLQLFSVQKLRHGIILAGAVGVGKSGAWRILLAAMEKLDGIKGVSYIIDPKALRKDQLYGRLDSTTLEWSDGVFTSILRRIANGGIESNKRHWIIFDGDVDPEWAENLNSVLDDNRLLTLPNGERLSMPNNVRIFFEVESLRQATLATVSRCGMVWFSKDVLPIESICHQKLGEIGAKYADCNSLGFGSVAVGAAVIGGSGGGGSERTRKASAGKGAVGASIEPTLQQAMGGDSDERLPSLLNRGFTAFSGAASRKQQIVEACVDSLTPFFEHAGFIRKCLDLAAKFDHIMAFTEIRLVEALFALIKSGIKRLIDYYRHDENKSIDNIHIELFISKWLLFSIVWSMGGSLSLENRMRFASEVTEITGIPIPGGAMARDSTSSKDEINLLDYEPKVDDGQWMHLQEVVTKSEIQYHQVIDASLVIDTIDTVRHHHILESWLHEKMPFILCGPPGSGKTMTLTSVLKGISDFDIAFLNYSSGSTPELLLKTFDHYCEYHKTTNGIYLRPIQPGRQLIIFADEINLPMPDQYGTQHVITFMRQLVEAQGFWRLQENTAQWVWVVVQGIQFAGACNPPTDAGRHHMDNRFLRHAPLMFVDFPGKASLKQIYETFNSALLRPFGGLQGMATCLTTAMVEFYDQFSTKFTVDMQPHYIYSPRELTRWKVALHEALRGSENSATVEEFIRLFVHEGLRIFQDRLVYEEERVFTDHMIDEIVMEHLFPFAVGRMQTSSATSPGTTLLARPILFTHYISKDYKEVSREELRNLVEGKLRVFNEEELNVKLVLFNEVLDHVVKIDRVLRQPLGHLLLVGASGAGKTVLSKFVSWLNGLSVFTIKAGRKYNTTSFEADLRHVMKRAGVKEEKICFIFDESNVLGPAFLERMNALLASGEVPGLFEGDEYVTLISECKTAYGADVGTEEVDLFLRFTKQVQNNLHIVFTMNPANPDFSNRQATSPALFNRCVIDWFDDWPDEALMQVAYEYTMSLATPSNSFIAEEGFELDEEQRKMTLSSSIVAIHNSVVYTNNKLMRNGKKYNYTSPRDFINFIKQFISIIEEKKFEVTDQQRHLNVGLSKLNETEQQVEELQVSLADKEKVLSEKNKLAEEKMQLMVEQQTEAEQKKKESEKLAQSLAEKLELIQQRKLEVDNDLSKVAPLLTEAQEAVNNIPKKSLDELKSMLHPPVLVKAAVEATAALLLNLEDKPISWDDARKLIKTPDFINRIITFDCKLVNPATRRRIQAKFATDEWDVERINKASRAAGPLAKWAESSVQFVVISEMVQPLQQEILDLEKETRVSQEELSTQQRLIGELEVTLNQLKIDYAQLISQVENLKRQMETVGEKIGRSRRLLTNLASEKKRWESTAAQLHEAQWTILGDCLLSAAFCTYIGFFEHSDRRHLDATWKMILSRKSLRRRPDLSLVEFLSRPSERLEWALHSLPTDDLSTENAIILKRYLRYPLIIDPSGQASLFLMNFHASRKISKTSFLDAAFLKNLESALRFGTTLFVQDVEKVDPILNSVLNQETQKQGGRVLITVGDSEIDFSPSFSLFLATRDPTVQFTPDLSSRVTFVNFTVTPSSLQNQCLNEILKSERPDVDKKRSDILKLQGEFKVKIRELEDELLHSLSNVQGNILDNETVVTSLETLKSQAAEIMKESNRTDEVLREIESVSSQYLPLAQAATIIFFSMQHLSHLNAMYQFDLRFFFHILKHVLAHPQLSSIPKGEYGARLKVLFSTLFRESYERVARGILYEDRLAFALQLMQIRCEIDYGQAFAEEEFQALLRQQRTLKADEEDGSHASPMESILQDESQQQKSGASSSKPMPGLKTVKDLLSAEQQKSLANLIRLKWFSKLYDQIESSPEAWIAFLSAAEPEKLVPIEQDAKDSSAFSVSQETPIRTVTTSATTLSTTRGSDQQDCLKGAAVIGIKNLKVTEFVHMLRKLLVIKALRADRLIISLLALVEAVLGDGFLQVPEISQSLLRTIVQHQSTPETPIVLLSTPGFDPSNKILSLAGDVGTQISSIAMGSPEGYQMVEKALAAASKSGIWLLLKNVHLSPLWLNELEKKLYRLSLAPNFRIFLTMEFNTKVSLNLLRISYTITFEPPAGLKASLQRSYSSLFGSSYQVRPPVVARNQLHFLLAFVHAVILERKRFCPVGWTKSYEFSDADQKSALHIIDSWLDLTSMKVGSELSEHIDPARIPWQAICSLLTSVCYGGRIDSDVDLRVLQSFLEYLFTPLSFESGFVLHYIPSKKKNLVAPELTRSYQAYLDWVDGLDLIDDPIWFGLSSRSRDFINAQSGLSSVVKWCTLRHHSREEIFELSSSSQDSHELKPSLSLLRFTRLNTSPTKHLTHQGSIAASSWLLDLLPQVQAILSLLPKKLLKIPALDAASENPILRSVYREYSVAYNLLQQIHEDLESLVEVCEGNIKFTNKLRDLANCASGATVPSEWKKYSTLSSLSMFEWIQDFTFRCNQIMKMLQYWMSSSSMETSEPVWIGGLFYPSAFFTANSQKVAQNLQWSLDDLSMSLEVGVAEKLDNCCVVTGLTVEGALWNEEKKSFILSDEISSPLPASRLTWVTNEAKNSRRVEAGLCEVSIPIFLNRSRRELICFVTLLFPKEYPAVVWYQRGTAILLWSDI